MEHKIEWKQVDANNIYAVINGEVIGWIYSIGYFEHFPALYVGLWRPAWLDKYASLSMAKDELVRTFKMCVEIAEVLKK